MHFGSSDERGAAYVFHRADGVWAFEQELLPSDLPGNGLVGSSVALDGETAVVGAPTHAAAHVFVRGSDGVWSQQASLTSPFGVWNIAVSGDRALTSSGGAFSYVRSAGVWTAQGQLDALFTSAIGLDGDLALICAFGGTGYPLARFYRWSGTEWSLESATAETTPSDSASVDLVGNRAVIGFPNPFPPSSPSEVFVYEQEAGVWVLRQRISGPSGFGESVSLSSQSLAIGDDFGASVYSLATGLFHTVLPCRLADTRAPSDGPALTHGASRGFIAKGKCGIPSSARSLALNVTVVDATGRAT